jgi:hypothetical protein
MKKIIPFVAALLFSTLFYQQDIGINLSLFTILTCLVLIILHGHNIRHKDVIFKIIAYFITGIMVFMYHSTLAILANILCFFTLVGSFAHPKTSIYINWFNGLYASIASYFSRLYNKINVEEKSEKKQIDYLFWAKIIGIPSILILVFIGLYRASNPVFNDLIESIDFGFINVHWLLFTVLGYFLFYNISHPEIVETPTNNDLMTDNYLERLQIEDKDHKKLDQEKKLGFVLLILLNLLILIFLGTDVYYINELYGMNASELSQQVHNGVNALIASNLIAIAIILYFFRGQLNFFKQNKDLKMVTGIWIMLNLFVVFTTVLKNVEYIQSFGLTYKRIGVIFFLMATSIGLVTTYLKVIHIKNMWFLFRINLSIAFVVFVMSTTVNWDKIITHYNLYVLKEAEIHYLIRLSNNNAFQLYEYAQKHGLEPKLKERINGKYFSYLEDLQNNNWQEIVFDNIKLKK